MGAYVEKISKESISFLAMQDNGGKGGRRDRRMGHRCKDRCHLQYNRNEDLAEVRRLVVQEVNQIMENRFADWDDTKITSASDGTMVGQALSFLQDSWSSNYALRDKKWLQAGLPGNEDPKSLSRSGSNGSGKTGSGQRNESIKDLVRRAFRLQWLLGEKRLNRELLVERGILMTDWTSYGRMTAEVVDMATMYPKGEVPYTTYYIQVQLIEFSAERGPQTQYLSEDSGNNGNVWKVRRRYSDFQKMDRLLRCHVGSRALASR